MGNSSRPTLMIITNYFPPEIGAASNRIFQLANGLSSDYNIRVVTPMPNYPTGRIFKDYKYKLILKTYENGIGVHRLWVYASASKNKFLRFLAMLSYSISLALYILTHRQPNKIIIQSPPLLVAFTSLLLLKSNKRKLILNVSDLWPKAGLDLGALKKNWLYSFLKKIERYNYFNSNLILGQSNEILEHISKINPEVNTFLYRNYPIVNIPVTNSIKRRDKRLTIVYAGLLGVAQGILKLCYNLDFSRIDLHLYGSGAEEKEIQNFIDRNPKLPIFFHGKVDRNELHKKLVVYDMAIIPLVNRIYGSVPSKIFELSQLGLPLIYFGGGEGENIISTYNLGWVVKSGSYKHLNAVIASIKAEDLEISVRENIKTKATKEFNFTKQLDNLIEII